MTLERHKSSLIPDIQYSLDGTLFVTESGGTFPLRGKGTRHGDIRNHDFAYVESAPSYRSYDARREEKKRRYKQRSSPSREATMSGTSTISTNRSSLGRRLRRSKRGYSAKDTDFRFNDRNSGSISGSSEGRRLRTGPPRMTADHFNSIQKKQANKRRSLDGSIQGKDSLKRTKRNNNDLDYDNKHRHSNGSGIREKARYHKIHSEKLPYVVFLIDGVFLLLAGIVRMIISYWHEYYSALWAGVLVLILGIIGAKHRGLYLSKPINSAYIWLAFLTGIAMLAASGLILRVFLPMVMLLVDKQGPSAIITQIKFTNLNKTLSTVEMSASAMTWASIALDISTLIFIFVGLFAMTAAMIAFSNHWDACYDTTADCDHRGNPRLFNPIEQVSLGTATAFVGLAYIAAEASFSHVHHNHFFAPLWSSGMVIVAGVISFCFGKRIDQLAMGTFACFVEILAFSGCGVATVLTTLGVVDDVGIIQGLTAKNTQKYNELMGMTVIGCVFDLILTVNVIFIVGTIFRHFRQVCCHDCCRTSGTPDKFGSMERASKYNSLGRNQYSM